MNLFESGDLEISLDFDAFTQDCQGHEDLSYEIKPEGGLTDFDGPAGCLCEKNENTCNVCSPFTDLDDGKCECTFEYEFDIDSSKNNATLSIQNVILSDNLFKD